MRMKPGRKRKTKDSFDVFGNQFFTKIRDEHDDDGLIITKG